MSMGYLLPKNPEDPEAQHDTPIVWRGLMVMKAVQQLLFDVDWTTSPGGPGLDVLVIDMPPGTGDVPLTLGQLVKVDGQLKGSVVLHGLTGMYRCRDCVYPTGCCTVRCSERYSYDAQSFYPSKQDPHTYLGTTRSLLIFGTSPRSQALC